MKHGLLNLYLLWGTLQDIKEKRISFLYLRIGVILSLLFFIGEGIHLDLNVMVVFLSLVPGLIFLLIAKVSKEKIGLGDGWLFLIIAAWVGTETTWIIWYGSLLLSALFSIVMVILKKYKMQSQLPFIPFIWLAHLFLWSLNYGN